MQTAFIVRGNLKDTRTVELEEPVHDLQGPVEVTLRPLDSAQEKPLCETLSPEEWKKMFHAWIESHDPNLPILPDEALRREAMYEDRW
jgi:hypothetical protein